MAALATPDLWAFDLCGDHGYGLVCIEEVPTHRDAIATFKLLGHLPLLLHENPKTVLVNAVGGGVTLGAVAKHDVTVEAVDIVPDVRDAMSLFGKENDNVLQRTNWRLIADDGRHFLKVSPQHYDVIAYYKQITTLEFLDLLNARYTELFNSPTPQTLLPKTGFAAQLQPQNPFVQELLGVTLLKLKRYEEAVGPLEAAVALKGDDVNYLSNLAFAYDQVGRSTDALRVLKQAKTVKPEAAKFLDEAIKRIEQKLGASGYTERGHNLRFCARA